ncbi:MAG TPA: hypothetical protein VLH12_08770 [Usitatibacter sp.]|nr:hypothetical protein [Usitatibacter sp.]
MEKTDVQALAQKMISAVKSHVADALRPLAQRLDDFDARLRAIPPPEKGDKGDKGDAGQSIKGDAGKDADPEFIRTECARLVAEIPRPKDGKDGKDAEPVDVEAIIARVAAQLPEPRHGKDGESVDLLVVQAMVADEVTRAVAALPKPRDGEHGRDGKDGASVHPDTVALMVATEVAKAIAAMPPPKDGEDGRDGKDGLDGASVHQDTVAVMVADQVAKAVAAIPRPKDGLDGEAGRDAAELDILPSIDESKSYRRGQWASHAGGLIRAARATDPVVEGDITAAGWVVMVEGLACPPVVTQGDDPREITVAAMLTSGVKAVTTFRMPAMVYREVWRDGEYEQGDVVTWSGSAWHCQQKTTDQPGTSATWKLMVKKGAPGKDGGGDSSPPVRDVVRVK